MPIDKRNFILSNTHRSNADADTLNNGLRVTLPDSIFSGKIESINLKHLYIDFDYETIGTSNNELIITSPQRMYRKP